MPHPPELKQAAIRLRTEKLFSLREVADTLGIAQGTASLWLREHPLPEDERVRRASTAGPKPKDRGTRSPLHKMAKGELTRHQKGKVAEAAAMMRLFLHGFEVYCSHFDGDRYDWIASRDGKLTKLQIKWASPQKTGLPLVPLKSRGNRYQEGDFDYLVGYDLLTDTCYVWSWEETSHLSNSVSVSSAAAERWDKLS